MSDRIAVMSAGRIRQIGKPGSIYRQPADRFVASFVGETNEFQGVCVSGDAVRVGNIILPVAAAVSNTFVAGESVDVFVRPEELSVASPHAAGSISASIVTAVYQGGHTDLYVEASVSPRRILLRVPATEVPWQEGAAVGLVLPSSLRSVFKRSD